jgi:hypothetical protein
VSAIMALGRAMVSDAADSVYGNPDPEEFVL